MLETFAIKPFDISWASAQYTYSTDGDVITGDLGIVNNEQLWELLTKDPKYWILHPINGVDELPVTVGCSSELCQKIGSARSDRSL